MCPVPRRESDPEFFLVCDCPGCQYEGPRALSSDAALSLASQAGWEHITRASYVGPRWLCPRCAAESQLFEVNFTCARK